MRSEGGDKTMKFEHTEVFNFEGALRGMRLPMQSFAKADSHYCTPNECITCKHYGKEPEVFNNTKIYTTCAGDDVEWVPYLIGDNDMDLAQRLVKAGSPHDKWLRQCFVSMDITASLAWWKQMDQYRVGVVTNSESTMHCIHKNPITIDCFEIDNWDKDFDNDIPNLLIPKLEELRQKFLETKDKRYWDELIRWLPESWLQKRTWTGNYAILRNIIGQRAGHKMSSWQQFINHCKQMPYAEQFLFYKGETT